MSVRKMPHGRKQPDQRGVMSGSMGHARPLIIATVVVFALVMSWNLSMPNEDEAPLVKHVIEAQRPALVTCLEISKQGNRDFIREPIVITLPRKESYDVECEIGCRVSNQWHKPSDARASLGSGIRVFISQSDPGRSISELKSEYHVVATPSFGSDVPTPVFSWRTHESIFDPMDEKDPNVPMTMLMSTCDSPNGRYEFAEELMRHLTVDSYGECLGNKESPWPDDFHSTMRNAHAVDLMKRYKFAASFEPTDRDDYVSERFYMALQAGAIPVHFGPKNIHRYAPGRESVLAAQDFKSPAHLARKIQNIASNVIAYKKMIAWKNNGTSPNFNSIAGYDNVPAECRVCIRVADLYRRGGEASPAAGADDASISKSITLQIRSRGFYSFLEFTFDPPRDTPSLRERVVHVFADKKWAKLPAWCEATGDEPLFEIKRLGRDWQLREGLLIASDKDVTDLRDGDELEVSWDWRPKMRSEQ